MRTLPRSINLKTYFLIFRNLPKLAYVGFISLIPLLIFTIMSIVFSFVFNDGNDSVDYSKVLAEGKTAKGIVTEVETIYNVTINEEHPKDISFSYVVDEMIYTSKVRTMSLDKAESLHFSKDVEVVYLGEEAIIKGIKPYSFPAYIFLIAVAVFLLIALPFVFYGFRKFNNIVTLYKYGEVNEAEIVSIEPISLSPFGIIRSKFLVHYQYTNEIKEKLLGSSFTSNYAIVNEKKQGDNVRIFVSKNDQSKSCLIPKLVVLENKWELE